MSHRPAILVRVAKDGHAVAAVVLVLVVAPTLIGCRAGSTAPPGWAPAPPTTPTDSTHPPTPVSTAPIATEPPSLQVYIHYTHTHSSHTALRVATGRPFDPPVFWDPGGAYGLTKPHYGRHHDVVLHRPPDPAVWWDYRKTWLREPLLLVFEWDLTDAHAHRLRNALLDGAHHGRDATHFQTLTTPGLCNFGVTDYLRAFGPPLIDPDLPRSFWPDTLARHLWKQRPDRVLRFQGPADAKPTVLLPPPDSSLAKTRYPQFQVSLGQ
ncbi:MAG: hypothetical protein AAFX76_09455 [Planctomycetota bacterium]